MWPFQVQAMVFNVSVELSILCNMCKLRTALGDMSYEGILTLITTEQIDYSQKSIINKDNNQLYWH